MTPRCFGHRAPLLWIVLPYTAGVACGHVASSAPPVSVTLGTSLALLIGAGICLRVSLKCWPWFFCASMLTAGVGAYALHRARLPDWETLPPREARVALRVDRLYPQKEAGKISGLGRIVRADRHLEDLIGQPLFFTLRLTRKEAVPGVGCVLRALGLVSRAPARSLKGGFEAYLCAQGINFRLERGRLLAVEQTPSDYRQFCIRTAARFSEILGIGLEKKRPALAGVLRAMLLGRTDALSVEQNAWFMRSGTMHLFAISGLHITSMALALRLLCAFSRIPNWIAYLLVLTLLWLYVDITGASPSAVRAYLMVAVFETALLTRQTGNSLATLGFALSAAVLWNPLQIFQAGFQMSYAIVAILLLAGLPFSDWLGSRWHPLQRLPKPLWRWWHRALDTFWHWLCSALAIGLSTLSISLFFGVFHFLWFTPGALLANLALIPLSDCVLFAGLASLSAGLLGLSLLSHLFNHAAGVVLWAMEHLVQMILLMPGAAIRAEFRWAWMGEISILALLAVCLSGYAFRWSQRRVGWWAPAALTVVVLAFGVRYSPT